MSTRKSIINIFFFFLVFFAAILVWRSSNLCTLCEKKIFYLTKSGFVISLERAYIAVKYKDDSAIMAIEDFGEAAFDLSVMARNPDFHHEACRLFTFYSEKSELLWRHGAETNQTRIFDYYREYRKHLETCKSASLQSSS